MTLGTLVTIVIDITAETTATGRIVWLGKHVVIIEDANGERHCSNRLNAKIG